MNAIPQAFGVPEWVGYEHRDYSNRHEVSDLVQA